MALVVRSKRDFKFSANTSGIIGPGDYNPSDVSLEKKSKIQNQVPFNTNSLRLFDFSENKKNPSVGPGSYYKSKQRTFIRKTFNKNLSNIEILNKKELYNLALFKVGKKKSDIKLNDQKSLIIDKDDKTQVMNIKKSKNKSNPALTSEVNLNINLREKPIKRFYKIIPTTLTKNRVNSIPSKECCLGYDFDRNGLPMIVDPSQIKNLYPDEEDNGNNEEENEKNNMYNNIKKDKINAIDWSKMSKKEISGVEITTKDETTIVNNNSKILFNNTSKNVTNVSNIKKRLVSSKESLGNLLRIKKHNNNSSIKSIKTIETYNSSLGNNEINMDKNSTCFYNDLTGEYPNKKLYRPKGHIYKIKNKDIRLKSQNISLEDFVYNNLFKGEPGPGYYQESSDFDKYQLIPSRYKNFHFGSREGKCKDNYYKLSENINLGPGQYFLDKNTPKFKACFFPLSRKEDTVNLKKYEEDLVKEKLGPGKYDVKSQFDKTQMIYNGPLAKRFPEKKQIMNPGPGPGEYIKLVDWEKKATENQSLKPTIFIYNYNSNINNIKSEEKNNKKEEKKESERYAYISKNKNPGVGDYNPDIVNSIKYNIISKDNKISNMIAPFSSGQVKFLKKSASTSNLVGPGSYFLCHNNIWNNIIKKEDNKKVNHYYKNDGMKKDNIKYMYNQMKSNLQRQVGPGSYELQQFNDWNKKSFNYLYI